MDGQIMDYLYKAESLQQITEVWCYGQTKTLLTVPRQKYYVLDKVNCHYLSTNV